MKKIVYLLVGMFLGGVVQAQPLNWIIKAEGDGEENITAQCFLPDGHVAIAGIFEKKHGMHLQAANAKGLTIENEATRPNEQYLLNNFFLAKYSKRGTLIWALNSTGTSNAYPYSICSDTKGNIIIGGSFQGNLKLPSADGSCQILEGSRERAFCCGNDSLFLRYNYFIAKYSNDGNLLWCKSARAMDNAFAEQVCTDDNDAIYVKAYCATNAFAIDGFALVGDALGSSNYGLICIKYTPQGNALWASFAGNLTVKNMDVRANGSIRFLADHNNHATIWNTSGSNYKLLRNYNEPFELTFDQQGNVTSVNPVFASIHHLTIQKYANDNSGNYYVIAQKEPDPYNPSNNLSATIGKDSIHPKEHDLFLIKLSPTGTVSWYAAIAGTEMRKVFDVLVDKNQNPILTGSGFAGPITITDVKTSKTISPEAQNPLVWYKLFKMNFSSDGRFINSTFIADVGPPAFVEKTELCRLSINHKGDLLISAAISQPTELNGQTINMTGPIGYFPYYDTVHGKYGVYKHSDAYFGIIRSNAPPDLDSNWITQIKQNTVFVADKESSVLLFPNPVEENQYPHQCYC